MDFTALIKKMLIQYIIIYACTMFATLVFCSIFYPDVMFGLDYLAWMLLFSLLGDLPTLVFYSKRELTEKEWITRQGIHIVLLEMVLLYAGLRLDMYEGVTEGIVFALVIIAIYVLVRFITMREDLKLSHKLNERLKERKNREMNGE